MAELKQGGSTNEIVRDLFENDNIKGKTDLNPVQIESVNKLKTLARIMNVGLLHIHLDDFMTLQLSKDRKSRAEFVNGLIEKKGELMSKGKNFFQTLLG